MVCTHPPHNVLSRTSIELEDLRNNGRPREQLAKQFLDPSWRPLICQDKYSYTYEIQKCFCRFPDGKIAPGSGSTDLSIAGSQLPQQPRYAWPSQELFQCYWLRRRWCYLPTVRPRGYQPERAVGPGCIYAQSFHSTGKADCTRGQNARSAASRTVESGAHPGASSVSIHALSRRYRITSWFVATTKNAGKIPARLFRCCAKSAVSASRYKQ